MSNDPFSGIAVFVAVAEKSSFRAAAEHLGITTAGVSKSILRLEEELQIRLFDRTTRKVELTNEGNVFYKTCAQALSNVRRGRAHLETSRKSAEGDLNITLPFVLGPLVTRLLPEFNDRFPLIKAYLHLTDRSARLVDDRIDIALRIGSLNDSTDIVRPLMKTHWITVASPEYIMRRGEPTHPKELTDHDCITYRSTRGIEVAWDYRQDEGVDSYRAKIQSRLVLNQGQLLVDGALAGGGLTHVFSFMVNDLIRTGRLRALLQDYQLEGPPINVLYKSSGRRSPKVRAFVSYIREELARRELPDVTYR